jgi:hypothetical protein
MPRRPPESPPESSSRFNASTFEAAAVGLVVREFMLCFEPHACENRAILCKKVTFGGLSSYRASPAQAFDLHLRKRLEKNSIEASRLIELFGAYLKNMARHLLLSCLLIKAGVLE